MNNEETMIPAKIKKSDFKMSQINTEEFAHKESTDPLCKEIL